MLESIALKFTELAKPLVVPTQGVTVFVGPNNSGKSLALKEVEQYFQHHEKFTTKIVEDFKIIWPTEEQATRDIEALAQKHPHNREDHFYLGRFNPAGEHESVEHHKSGLIAHLKNQENYRWIASQFYRFFTIRLDGRTRFELTNDRSQGDLLAPQAQNVLAHLFRDGELRKQVRDVVYDAFNLYFVIDPTDGGKLRIRLSAAEPMQDKQSLSPAAREFHSKATYIKGVSDGMQAFVGIVTAVYSGDYRVILIDEPEAFLHPPLARKLGFQLTSVISKRNGVLLASTHSADFLMGCLQASTSVRVVRLEYSNGKSKGQIVDSTVLTRLFKRPLMRSANVISALFHDGVVVTESDNDRVFYAEIYHRLAELEKGYPSLLFVNAQNKQTIQDIIGPLRKFGVPAAAIVDIDILKDGGKTWTGWLDAIQVPSTLRSGYGVTRGDICKKFVDLRIDMKTSGGVGALPAPEKSAANQFFDTLDEYGLFSVRKGELETWLRHLGAAGKKTDWTVDVLDKMGSDTLQPGYLMPSTGDAWDFMRKIIAWVKNPARKATT
jgi:ABC-type cobalamin/Fe3+-siderophores transport system ATPase subunit